MTNAEKIIANRGGTVTSERKTATNAAAHATNFAATVANGRRKDSKTERRRRLVRDALDAPQPHAARAIAGKHCAALDRV